jgi:hypothetical protein
MPFWRKLFSSNWWWYGEVNPDPARLPPPERRPKLWRGDAIFVVWLMPILALVVSLSAELNSRYWPFNHSQLYSGVILSVRNSDRPLLVQLADTRRVEMGWPVVDTLGFQRQINWRPGLWAPAMKDLLDGYYQCPGRRLRFYGETWKFTFRPVIRIWRVECADTNITLIDGQWVERKWRAYVNGRYLVFGGVSLGFSLFFLIFIVHRERKLYVKG